MSEKNGLGAQFAPVSERFDPVVSESIKKLRELGWYRLADKVEVLAIQKATLPPERFTFKNMGGVQALSVTLWENNEPCTNFTEAGRIYMNALAGLGLAANRPLAIDFTLLCDVSDSPLSAKELFGAIRSNYEGWYLRRGEVAVYAGVSTSMQDLLKAHPETLRTLPDICGRQGGAAVPHVPAEYQLRKTGGYTPGTISVKRK